MPQTVKQQRGELAEKMACDYLRKQGFDLIEQNFRCNIGEIDLIMQDGDDIVFVEVRSRSRTDYGHASETINRQKQRKIINAATWWLQQRNWLYTRYSRFDVVAIHYINDSVTLDWFKNAFLAG